MTFTFTVLHFLYKLSTLFELHSLVELCDFSFNETRDTQFGILQQVIHKPVTQNCYNKVKETKKEWCLKLENAGINVPRKIVNGQCAAFLWYVSEKHPSVPPQLIQS